MSKHSTQEQITSRSVLRHRPISPAASTDEAPLVPRASRGRSSQRHDTKQDTNTAPQPGSARQRRQHWLFPVGIGMLFALVLGLLAHFAYAWINLTLDDLHYGRPRTFQVDAFVGHETTGIPSHFIALNLHGHIEVIEFPGGDGTHAKIFLGPQLYGNDADLVPVTLTFVDRRHDHHPDMLVVFAGSQIVFHNEQGTFHPSA